MEKVVDKTFGMGKKIAELRHSRELSQHQVAARTDMSPAKIGFIETGKQGITLGDLKRIAHTLGYGVKIEFTAYETMPEPPPPPKPKDPILSASLEL